MAFENILNSKHVIITVNIDDERKEHFPEIFSFEIQRTQAILKAKIIYLNALTTLIVIFTNIFDN